MDIIERMLFSIIGIVMMFFPPFLQIRSSGFSNWNYAGVFLMIVGACLNLFVAYKGGK